MAKDASENVLRERKQKVRLILRRLSKLFPKKATILRYGSPWELLVAVQLSAQCTDKKVNEVTDKLFRKYRSLDDYVKADPREFEKDIYATGFYKNKAKNILLAAKKIKEDLAGELPRSIDEMVAIPGVGRKTANVVLGNAFHIVEGIAVDTHVRRLSRLLGLTKESDPVKIERDLMQVVPKDAWFDFTYYLIDYGRAYCFAKKHDHANCPLADIR